LNEPEGFLVDFMPQALALPSGPLKGLSARLIESHHANNYTGAVKRLNATRAELATIDFTLAPGFQINGLKREELIATNSMPLQGAAPVRVGHRVARANAPENNVSRRSPSRSTASATSTSATTTSRAPAVSAYGPRPTA
jgi:hypothetical protein